MTVAEMLTAARDFLQDPAGDHWSADELYRHFSRMQEDLCRRSRILTEQVTLDVHATLTTPARAFYGLPATFLEVYRVHFSGKTLARIDEETAEIYSSAADWSVEGGTPQGYVYGPYGPLALRLWPIPASDSPVADRARMPSAAIAVAVPPEVPSGHHITIVYGGVALAYLKDFDLRNPDKAKTFLALYEKGLAAAMPAAARTPEIKAEAA